MEPEVVVCSPDEIRDKLSRHTGKVLILHLGVRTGYDAIAGVLKNKMEDGDVVSIMRTETIRDKQPFYERYEALFELVDNGGADLLEKARRKTKKKKQYPNYTRSGTTKRNGKIREFTQRNRNYR